MACPVVITGDEFLVRVLGHIDCQAQLLGSYGYQALGQPGSLASGIMLSLLTLFVALFGYRLLFGPAPGGRDVVGGFIKIGIVLTIAFSWPAFRTVIYDVTLKGPAEIASTISSTSQASSGNMAQRLQRADNAMVNLTATGMGRNTGAFIEGAQQGGSFRGSALEDESALGFARLSYLSGVIGSLALLRLAAGLLLALAPLAAGLLLFEQTRGLFSGWLRGLVLVTIGSIGASIVLGAQLAIIEPWLADAIRVRTLGYATPAAPIELFAINLAFAVLHFAMIWLLAKVAFTRGWISIPSWPDFSSQGAGSSQVPITAQAPPIIQNRAEQVANNVRSVVRREEHSSHSRTNMRVSETSGGSQGAAPSHTTTSTPAQPRLGSSYRRSTSRTSSAARRRDSN